MAKVFIEETTLTAIGDAIREKTGGSDLIAPGAMPAEIKSIVAGGGGEGDCNGLHVPEEALVISGVCNNRFVNNGWNWFIEKFGDKITTQSISQSMNMFLASDALVQIPFELNYVSPYANSINSLQGMFDGCKKLSAVPSIKNVRVDSLANMFNACNSLKSIPDDLTDTWDWSLMDNQTSSYSGAMNSMFNGCYNLRKAPTWCFLHGNPRISTSSSITNYGFNNCYSLEKVEGIRLATNASWTSNAFNYMFTNCYRLKSVTFALQPDGTPYVHNIKNQTIDLSTAGFVPASSRNAFLLQCTDFTQADEITDWHEWVDYCGETSLDYGSSTNGYAVGTNYATFSRKSAKRLFDTLPDVTAGSGNTIKLERDAASELKSQEAMKLLTEEEIAVAAARGWTVTLV